MKVRIGFGLGTRASSDPDRFAALVATLEQRRFDSLWLSERVTGDCPDPIVALSVAAGMTQRLKLGFSVLVLPGRNPMLVAKELATLDRLSSGRLLPAFGLGAVDPAEHQAFGVARGDRAKLFDETLPLLRRFWAGDVVDHVGPFHQYEGAVVRPQPQQDPLEIWLGGLAPSELRRCGRLGDGWLPSFCTPASVARGIDIVNHAATASGRSVDPEHFGVLVGYIEGPIPPPIVDLVSKREPNADPRDVVASSKAHLGELIEGFIAGGASKFVVLPYAAPSSPAAWTDELGALAATVLPLQRRW